MPVSQRKKIVEHGLYRGLGRKMFVAPVLPYFVSDFYEDFGIAFIVGSDDRVEAELDMPPLAKIVFHKRAFPYPLHYSTAIIANQVIGEGLGSVDKESINDVMNMLIRKVFPTIKKSIRRRNIDIFKEVEKDIERIIGRKEIISEAEAKLRAERLQRNQD